MHLLKCFAKISYIQFVPGSICLSLFTFVGFWSLWMLMAGKYRSFHFFLSCLSKENWCGCFMNCKYMCMYMYLLEEITNFYCCEWLLWLRSCIWHDRESYASSITSCGCQVYRIMKMYVCFFRHKTFNLCMFFVCIIRVTMCFVCLVWALLWRVRCAALCLQACVPGWAPHVTTVWAVWVAAVVSTPAATPVWEPLTNQATRDQEAAPVLYQTAHGGALVRAVLYVAICLCYGAVQPRGAPLDKVWFRAFPGGPVWLGLPGPVSIPAVTFPARPQLVPVFGRDCLRQKRPYWGPLRVTLHGVWLDAYISL